MVTSAQIKAGLGDYLQTKMMPRLDGKRQFLLGMVYALAAGKMDDVVQAAGQNATVRALGIVDQAGNIDLDALFNAAMAQMQTQKKLVLDIPMLGSFSFDEGDLRDLRDCIARREGE